jgi:hypothetical protein
MDMNRARLQLVCGLLLGLAACQASTHSGSKTTALVPAPSYVDPNGMMPVLVQEPPHAIASSGDYRHEGSGLVLPLTIDGFRRVELLGFDPDDVDVSANYKLASARVAMTVYVFPVWLGLRQSYHVREIPEICASHFESMKAAAESRLKEPRLIEEAPQSNPRFPDAAVSRRAIYESAGDMLSNSPPLRSEIHMSCGVDEIWIVQYRVTYPQTENSDTVREDFMKAVPGNPQR